MALLADCISDVRVGLRQFRRAPRFFVLLFVLLVLGIGATTAMFSITWTLLVRPLPCRDPEQLVSISGSSVFDNVPLPQFTAWAKHATTLQQISAADNWLNALSSEGRPPEGLFGAKVSGAFFPMLGLQPLLGRLIEPNDDREGAPRVVVLGAKIWQRRFGSDPLVLGRTVLLDARPYAVIGVMPEGFDFSFPGNQPAELWTPRSAFPRSPDKQFENTTFSNVMARRRPDVTLEQVQAELARIAMGAVG